MRTYEEQVFTWIENFSIFGGSVQDCARGVFVDSQIRNMYPSNAAVCCLTVSHEVFGGNLKDKWADVLITFHQSKDRMRKPTYGKKLFFNIRRNSKELKGCVDLEKHKYITEVIYSGSKIRLLSAPEAEAGEDATNSLASAPSMVG
jgi:hypothetical protein